MARAAGPAVEPTLRGRAGELEAVLGELRRLAPASELRRSLLRAGQDADGPCELAVVRQGPVGGHVGSQDVGQGRGVDGV
jgi:hypothetical protein